MLKFIMAKKKQELKNKIKSGSLKIVFAPQNQVNFYEDIKNKFLEKVLNHPEAWISDESKLSNFNQWLPGVRLLTLENFNVDILPVIDRPLSEIFAYIDSKPKPSITVDELANELGLERKN